MKQLVLALIIPVLSCGGDEAMAPLCGDGVVDPGEVCDGSHAMDVLSCSDYGFIRGDLGCSADCLRRTTDTCVSGSDKPPACGDDVLDPGEECDGVLPPMMDCQRLGYPAGELACSASCTLDRSRCGDSDDDGGADDDPGSGPDPTGDESGTGKDDSCMEDASYACNDGDVYWFDSCGLSSGVKEDCGQSEYIGSKYCSGSAVYQDYRERGCAANHCTLQDDPVKQEDCNSGACENGTCVECGDGEEDVQGCEAGSYCPPGSRARQCVANQWSSWGECEADGPRYYGDGGERCGEVLCLTASSSGADSSLKAILSKNGGGSFDNDVNLVIYAPGTGDVLMYGCVATKNLSSYEFLLPMNLFDIDLGDTLEINAQIVSPCFNGGQHISGNVSISQCTK